MAAEEHARENSAKDAAAADNEPRSKKKNNLSPSKEATKAHGDTDATQPRTGDIAKGVAAPASFATWPPASFAESGRHVAADASGRHVAADAHNASAVAHLKQKPRAKVRRLPRVTRPRACHALALVALHVPCAHALSTCHR